MRLDERSLAFCGELDDEIGARLAIEDALPIVGQLLTHPLRCYELDAQQGQRTVLLLGAVLIGEEPQLVAAEIAVTLDEGKVVVASRAKARTAELFRPEARELLVDIAERLTPEGLAGKDPDGRPPRALVVGDMSSDQRTRLQRRLWAHGVVGIQGVSR